MDLNTDITVVISTYNRCEMIPAAIESVLRQEASGISYELIVVDNNSTDDTKQVVQSFISQGHHNLRYVFEPKQGLSHGRNAGITNARGAIIVFFDDDVRAQSDWLLNIKRAFDLYSDIDCVGGKILPNWKSDPPPWLNSDHWTALALQDHGNVPLCADQKKPLALAGANMAFRREVFQDAALFSPDFPRAQDLEFLVRFWRAGGRAMYVPEVVVFADVQPERLTKHYHRKWHATNGHFNSLMRLGEGMGPNGQILDHSASSVQLFEAPAYLYRQLLSTCGKWLVAKARGPESLSFKHENRVRFMMQYIRTRYEHEFASRNRSHLAEVGRFINAILRKKIRSRMSRDNGRNQPEKSSQSPEFKR